MAAIRRTVWAALRACCIAMNWTRILPRTAATAAQPLPKPRPVIYNSWEATEMKVNEAGQMALAEKAAAWASTAL